MDNLLINDQQLKNSWIYKKLFEKILTIKNPLIFNVYFNLITFALVIVCLVIRIYIDNNILYYLIIPLILLLVLVPIITIKINLKMKKNIINKWIVQNFNEIKKEYKIENNIEIKEFTLKTNKEMFGKRKNIDNELIKQTIKQLESLLNYKFF